MANNEVLAPIALTIPNVRGGLTPTAVMPTGYIFMSGGYLCICSGASIIQIGMYGASFSGASIT